MRAAHRQHRPADPAADRRARRLGADRSARPRGRSRRQSTITGPSARSQVLRMVIDRNDGPLADEVLVRVFREIMSACLAAAGAAQGRLSRARGHVQRAGDAQAFRPCPRTACRWGASRKCSRKSKPAMPISAWCRWRTRPGHDPGHAGHVPHVRSSRFVAKSSCACTSICFARGKHRGHRSASIRIRSRSRRRKAWLRINLPRRRRSRSSSNAEAARRARNADDAAAIAGEAAGMSTA